MSETMESEVPVKVKKIKEPIQHHDILGQPINLGNYLAVSHHNMLQICQVTKVNPKTLRVNPLFGYHKNRGYQLNPLQSVLISGPDAVAYILKNAGK